MKYETFVMKTCRKTPRTMEEAFRLPSYSYAGWRQRPVINSNEVKRWIAIALVTSFVIFVIERLV